MTIFLAVSTRDMVAFPQFGTQTLLNPTPRRLSAKQSVQLVGP
jgi:hypothetical protein